jgi:hypothetical protein
MHSLKVFVTLAEWKFSGLAIKNARFLNKTFMNFAIRKLKYALLISKLENSLSGNGAKIAILYALLKFAYSLHLLFFCFNTSL